MKYLHYFFIGIIIAAIFAFLLGKRLAASWLVVISLGLGLIAIALAALSWFNQQQSVQTQITELSQNLAEQERRNRKLEQSLSQYREKLTEQEHQNQALEQSLSQSTQKLSIQKLAEPEQPSQPSQQPSQQPDQPSQELNQKLDRFRQELEDAQVGLNQALMIMVSYQMAIQPIPGNHRGDCFVEKISLDRIHEMSMRVFGSWLRVIQNKDNRHSKDIREILAGERAGSIDLNTLENAIRELIQS